MGRHLPWHGELNGFLPTWHQNTDKHACLLQPDQPVFNCLQQGHPHERKWLGGPDSPSFRGKKLSLSIFTLLWSCRFEYKLNILNTNGSKKPPFLMIWAMVALRWPTMYKSALIIFGLAVLVFTPKPKKSVFTCGLLNMSAAWVWSGVDRGWIFFLCVCVLFQLRWSWWLSYVEQLLSKIHVCSTVNG